MKKLLLILHVNTMQRIFISLCLPLLFVSCNDNTLEGRYFIGNSTGDVINFRKDGTCQFCYKFPVKKMLGVTLKCADACVQGVYTFDGDLINIGLESRSDCPNIEDNGGFYKVHESSNNFTKFLVRPSSKDLPKRPMYKYPYTIIYRQHAINDQGMYESRNIPKGRDCKAYHITRSDKEDIEQCTEMNVLLYVRFFDEDSIVVKRFYSDAAEYEVIKSVLGKKRKEMVLDDNDLLPVIYSKTECHDISLTKNLMGVESLSFKEKVDIANNTNSVDSILENKFELRFVKFSDESGDYRSILNGFEIDNKGNKHEVVFIHNIFTRLSYEDRLFLENWNEEWAWVEGRDGRWYYENFGD